MKDSTAGWVGSFCWLMRGGGRLLHGWVGFVLSVGERWMKDCTAGWVDSFCGIP